MSYFEILSTIYQLNPFLFVFFDDFKRQSRFTVWISMDLNHKILKDLKWFCGFQKILWILKTRWKNDHNKLSFTLFSIQTILFIFLLERESKILKKNHHKKSHVFMIKLH